MISNIGNNLTRMDKYQNQLATGKVILVPSDDPIIATRALKLRTDVSEIEQYKRNTDDAQSWMDMTETTLSNINDVLQRTRELVVQGANGATALGDKKKISDEIKQLQSQLTHMANTTYAGRYLFSGYSTDTKLMNDDGTFAIDVDNSQSIEYEIGIGDDININVPGGDIFNEGAVAVIGNKSKMIDDFDKIIAALNVGDSQAVGNLIQNVDADIDNVSRVRSDLGARSNRLELTSNRLESDSINFTKLMSENEDVDMAETIIKLQNEENVYKASLSGGARIIQPSLIDFLR
jgi:flagellar hook-associated protein 3 FlgL